LEKDLDDRPEHLGRRPSRPQDGGRIDELLNEADEHRQEEVEVDVAAEIALAAAGFEDDPEVLVDLLPAELLDLGPDAGDLPLEVPDEDGFNPAIRMLRNDSRAIIFSTKPREASARMRATPAWISLMIPRTTARRICSLPGKAL
jgi:hypothetical protein